MHDIVTITRRFSRDIQNARTQRSILDHLKSEVAELEVEVIAGETGQCEGEDGIVGESIDVILCALDLIFRKNPKISNVEIAEIATRKCEKWARKYGSIDLSQYRNGLYRVHWTGGGSSLAAVGTLHDGARWLAPVNWTSPDGTGIASEQHWNEVERLELIADDGEHK
jgi:hypothetical protein